MKEYSEKVISAFMTCFKVKDIAAAAGISVSTVNKYKNDPAFMAVLNERRSAIVSSAVDKMTGWIHKDAEVLQKIIDDENVNPAVRQSAVNTMWVHLREWKAMIDFESRLRALETANFGDSQRVPAGGDTE